MKSIIKKILGKETLEKRRVAKDIKESSKDKIAYCVEQTESLNSLLNSEIEHLARIKLETLNDILNQFLAMLRDLRHINKANYSNLIATIGVTEEELSNLSYTRLKVDDLIKKQLDKATVVAVACIGLPTFVEGKIDTGPAVSSIADSPDLNELLAYLAVHAQEVEESPALSTAKLAATGALAVISAGLLASKHYGVMLAEANEYKDEVDEACCKMKASWVMMEKVTDLVSDMSLIVDAIHKQCNRELNYFEPIIPDFDVTHSYHVERFKEMVKWIKGMNQFVKVPIFDKNMNIREEVNTLILEISSDLESTFN